MANSRSARKRIRANERKHVRNRAIRSSVRTKVGKARRALVGLDETIDSQAQLLTAVSALDRAAAKGVLHPRNAARRKSRLMALAQRLDVAATEGDDALAAARAQALGGEKGRKTVGSRARAAVVAVSEDERDGATSGEAGEVAPATRGRGAGKGAAAGSRSKATTTKATPTKATTAKATTTKATTAKGGTSKSSGTTGSTRGRSKT